MNKNKLSYQLKFLDLPNESTIWQRNQSIKNPHNQNQLKPKSQQKIQQNLFYLFLVLGQ